MTILGAIEVRRRTNLIGLEVYLASLYYYTPMAHMVLFNRSPEHKVLANLLARYPVEVVDAQQFDLEHDISHVEIEIARFLQYKAWLEEHPSSAFILTDVLDVVWQGNFIRELSGLTIYQENNRIGACPFNLRWVKEVWPTGYGSLLDRPIVCCGVLVGDAKSVHNYLMWYTQEVHRRGAHNLQRGFDSAVLNGLAYGVAPDCVSVTPYVNDECMHLGYANSTSVHCDDNGMVWCAKAHPMIVHQYNRHLDVMQSIYKKWT